MRNPSRLTRIAACLGYLALAGTACRSEPEPLAAPAGPAAVARPDVPAAPVAVAASDAPATELPPPPPAAPAPGDVAPAPASPDAGATSADVPPPPPASPVRPAYAWGHAVSDRAVAVLDALPAIESASPIRQLAFSGKNRALALVTEQAVRWIGPRASRVADAVPLQGRKLLALGFTSKNRLVTVTDDRAVHLTRLRKPAPRQIATLPEGAVRPVVAPDGTAVWAIGADGRLHRVTTTKGKHTALGASGDPPFETVVPVARGKHPLALRQGALWRVHAKTGAASKLAEVGAVSQLAATPDGALVATAADATVRVWQVKKGAATAFAKLDAAAPVATLALARNGRWLALITSDGNVEQWRVDPKRNNEPRRIGLRGVPAQAAAIAFSRDSKTLAVAAAGDGRVALVEPRSGLRRLRVRKPPPEGYFPFEVGTEARTVCGASNTETVCWDAQTGLRKSTKPLAEDEADEEDSDEEVITSPGGEYSVFPSADGPPRVGPDRASAEPVRTEGVALAVSPTGQLVAGLEGGVEVWSSGGRPELFLPIPEVDQVLFTSAGLLVVPPDSWPPAVWDIATKPPPAHVAGGEPPGKHLKLLTLTCAALSDCVGEDCEHEPDITCDCAELIEPRQYRYEFAELNGLACRAVVRWSGPDEASIRMRGFSATPSQEDQLDSARAPIAARPGDTVILQWSLAMTPGYFMGAMDTGRTDFVLRIDSAPTPSVVVERRFNRFRTPYAGDHEDPEHWE